MHSLLTYSFQTPVKIKPINLSFQRADLVVADLTITYDREQAVDFTMPFMNLGKYDDDFMKIIKFSECIRKFNVRWTWKNYRYKYFVQKTNQATTEFIFVFISSIVGRVDLHGYRVPGCIGSSLHISQVTHTFMFFKYYPPIFSPIHYCIPVYNWTVCG